MKYALLLLLCLAGCSAPRVPGRTSIVEGELKIFTGVVMAVDRSIPAQAIVVLEQANGGLFSLITPFDVETETKAQLKIGQQVSVDYVLKYQTSFSDGKYFNTAKAGWAIKAVHVFTPLADPFGDPLGKPAMNLDSLFKDQMKL